MLQEKSISPKNVAPKTCADLAAGKKLTSKGMSLKFVALMLKMENV